MKDFDHQDATEDFDIEISDLPPSARSHYLLLKLIALKTRLDTALARFRRAGVRDRNAAAPFLTRKQRRAKVGRALTALGLCATFLLLLIGNLPDLRTRLVGLFEPPTPTATVAAYSSTLTTTGGVSIIVEQPVEQTNASAQGSPGPLPTTCPQANTLRPFMTSLDPPGLGGGPLWITGFNGPTAALVHLQPVGTSMSNPPGAVFGWYTTLSIFVQKGFVGSIVLHGTSQTGAPASELEFGYPDSLSFDPSFNLSLDNPAGLHFISDGPWEMTPVNVFIPMAGCYALQAQWLDVSWTSYFAAGR